MNVKKGEYICKMQDMGYLTFFSNRKETEVGISTILYCMMRGSLAEIHTYSGRIYKTRMKFSELESKLLGGSFIKIHRGCIVSVMAIHEINDKIILNNGEDIDYAVRKKKQIIEQFHSMQKHVIEGFNHEGIPTSDEEYKEHYRSFDAMPFAFTDIELIFNEETKAVDWIFRYGNEALARLERVSLENLIGHSFGSVFPNMDSKWLRAYERATLYREMLEIIDYSPEIDTNLKVICFPTFKGHCGCILFNIDEIKFIKNSNDTEKALMLYFGQMIHNNV